VSDTRIRPEPLLAAVLASSLDGVIMIDIEGRVVGFNPAAEHMFGYSRAETLGRPIGDLIVPEHLRQAHESGMARYLRDGDPHVVGKRIQIEAMRKDGRLFPIELAITEIDAGGNRLFSASLRDLSERKAAEMALAESNARLTAFLEYAPTAMYLKDIEGNYLVANTFMARALSRSLDQIIGHNVRDILAPSAFDQVRLSDTRILETGKSYVSEERFEVPGGYRDTMAVRFPVRNTDGRITHLGGVLIDITEKRQAEEMLRALSEQHPVALVMLRRSDHQVMLANPAFYKLTGDDGSGWLERISGRAELLERMAVSPEQDGFETQLSTGDRQAWVSVSWRETELAGEKALVITLIDIDARKAAEAEIERHREALHQAEKLTALGSLLAGVSHELNNPLSAVVGQSLMLEEDCEGTPHAARVAKIRTAAERCARIVQTFLAMARQKTPERRPLDLRAVVSAAVDLADYGMRTAGITVTIDHAPNLPAITGDSDQLHQVIVNLLINAQQAMQDQDGPRDIAITTRAEAGRVRLAIADTGPGVPAEVRNRIFEPFFTTKANAMGTGLGLSFSRGIIQAHGGTLGLLPETDGGATFFIELPIDALPASIRVAEPEAKPESDGRALVVDDEPSVGETLGEILMRQGFSVDVAASVAEAQALLAERDYRLILSDLRMPGLDGPALYRWLRDARPALAQRIGFVTGDTLGDSAAAFLTSANRPYLEKPFTPSEVRAIVAELTK
jgi:PAS domain S-box-containing protein